MRYLIPVALAGLVVFAVRKATAAPVYDPTYYADDPDNAPDLLDEAATVANEIANAVTGSPAAWYSTSEAMKKRLKKREALMLNRYQLGDGGWTIGYGRFYKSGGPLPPASIDRDTAERWFTEDLVERGEKWVKLYVSVPVTQNQFDALVSMAYNLRPSSFKRIAEAVNQGQDPTPSLVSEDGPGRNADGSVTLGGWLYDVFNPSTAAQIKNITKPTPLGSPAPTPAAAAPMYDPTPGIY